MTAKRHQALMIGNGALVLLLGLLCGFVLLFNLLGELALWPIPGSLKIQIPGESHRWVAAHLGNIMNALMLIAVALCLPLLRFSPRIEKFLAWGLIVTAWGNAGFYLLSAPGCFGQGSFVWPQPLWWWRSPEPAYIPDSLPCCYHCGHCDDSHRL